MTDEVLGSLDCEGIPQLVVYNKCDTANTVAFDPDILLTSAKTGYGLPALLAKLDEALNHRVRTIEIVLPYDKLALACRPFPVERAVAGNPRLAGPIAPAADRAAFFASYAVEPFAAVRRRFFKLPSLPVRAAGRLLSPEVKEKIRRKLKK